MARKILSNRQRKRIAPLENRRVNLIFTSKTLPTVLFPIVIALLGGCAAITEPTDLSRSPPVQEQSVADSPTADDTALTLSDIRDGKRASPYSTAAMGRPTVPQNIGSTREQLEEVNCVPPKCTLRYGPSAGHVKWLRKPAVSSSGELILAARIDEGHTLLLPDSGNGGASNIVLTDGGAALYGSVLPPSPPGWSWDPAPGQWIATRYEYRNGTLAVNAQIDHAASTHKGLTLCLWTGGQGAQNYILDCVPVDR